MMGRARIAEVERGAHIGSILVEARRRERRTAGIAEAERGELLTAQLLAAADRHAPPPGGDEHVRRYRSG